MRDAIPTVREMLERYIARQTRNSRLSARTADEYRALARCHLANWLDLTIDRVRAVDVTDRLEALKVKSPYAATKAAVILGATVRLAQDLDLDVKVPTRAFDPVPMKQREIDTSIPWALCRAEIDAVKNTVTRVAWLLLWHTASGRATCAA